MLMETETMLPADLAPVAAPALTPWGMYLAADVVVKAVMIALALASLATWTVLLAGWELARQARQLRAARALLLQSAQLPTQSEEATLQQGAALTMLDAARTELRLSQELDSHDGIKERVASRLERIELETARVQRRGIGALRQHRRGGAVRRPVRYGVGHHEQFHRHRPQQHHQPGGGCARHRRGPVGDSARPGRGDSRGAGHNHFSRVLAGLRGLLGDLSAAVQQLVSRDLDRAVPRAAAAPLRAVH